MRSKGFLGFDWGGGGRINKSSILGRFPAPPGPGGAWERPRPGPRSICIEFQPSIPIMRPLREVFGYPFVTEFELSLSTDPVNNPMGRAVPKTAKLGEVAWMLL